MLSRHNQKVMLQQNATTKQRFALRKLTVGVASVLVGLTFAGYNTSVSANAQNENGDTVAPTSDQKSETNNLNTKTLELGSTSTPKQLTSSKVEIKPFDPVKPSSELTSVSGGNTDKPSDLKPTPVEVGYNYFSKVTINYPGDQQVVEDSVPLTDNHDEQQLFKPIQLKKVEGYTPKVENVNTPLKPNATISQNDDGSYTLTLPKPYTPKTIDSMTINSNDEDYDYTVDYIIDDPSVTINYVDEEGKKVGEQKITGKPGYSYQIDYQYPEKYEPVNEDSQPQYANITNEKAAPITVKVKPKIRHWTEKKTITYIINVDGKQDYRHDYHFTKEHNTDETGGVPVWEGDNIGWTQPRTYIKPGYDTYINGEKTTETVAYSINPDDSSKDPYVIIDNVVYKALPQSIHIIYQNDEGKTVGKQEVSGVTDQTVDNVYKAPDGYFISDNRELPKTYTFNGDHNQDILVKVTKKAGQSDDPVTSNKDIANIVKFIDGDGNEVSHTVVSGKTGDKHNVKVPDGYHTKNQGHSVDVTIDDQKPEQIFTVIKDQSETGAPVTSDKDVLNVINYVDENGKTVKTDKVTGQDGDSITLSAPDGYHFVGQTPVLKINSSTPVQVVEVVADTPITNDTKPTKPIEQPSESDDERKSASVEVITSDSLKDSKSSSVVTTKTDHQSKQLPQTGNQSNVALVGLGAASLLGMFGLAGLARKRKE